MISRRIFFKCSLAAAFAPSLAFARSAFSEAAFTSAAQSGQPVLIEFHADWCPTCRAQEKVVNILVDQSNYKNVLVMRVLFDSEKDLLERFAVRRQSTLILFKNGTEVARAVGETSSDAIATLLNKAI